MDYSNRKGDSKYPLIAGYVFKLTTPALSFNKRINSKVNHTAYFWIQKLNKKEDTGKTKPQRRKSAKVLFMYIPQIVGAEKHYIAWHKDVQLETLVKYLSKGYEVVSEKCGFNYTDFSYRKFYETIGML